MAGPKALLQLLAVASLTASTALAQMQSSPCYTKCKPYIQELAYLGSVYDMNVHTTAASLSNPGEIFAQFCPMMDEITACNTCIQGTTAAGTADSLTKAHVLVSAWAFTCATYEDTMSTSKAYACWQGFPSKSSCSSLSAAGGGSGSSGSSSAAGGMSSMAGGMSSMAGGMSMTKAMSTMMTMGSGMMTMSGMAMSTAAMSGTAAMKTGAAAKSAAAMSASAAAAAAAASQSAAEAVAFAPSPAHLSGSEKTTLIAAIVVPVVVIGILIIVLMILKRKR